MSTRVPTWRPLVVAHTPVPVNLAATTRPHPNVLATRPDLAHTLADGRLHLAGSWRAADLYFMLTMRALR